MKISIAVPSLNYGQYLRDCLASIAGQTHRDFEVLIADGGSTDNSLEIVNEYVNADPRFRLVSSSDHGQAEGINTALARATGDLHCYLNADDKFICNDAFEAAVSAFNAYPGIDVIEFGGWYIDTEGRPIRSVRLRYHPRDSVAWMRYRTAVLQPGTMWRPAVTKRFAFEASRHFVFDAHFFFQAWREFAWMEVPKPIAGARMHPRNKSGSVRVDRVREIAWLEREKFGPGFRSGYVHTVATAIAAAEKVPILHRPLKRMLYNVVNSLAYLSFYRLPGI